jgi:hypothetical protein
LQKLVERAGVAAKIPFKVHPHMLRHTTGYVLANKGNRYPDTAKLLGSSVHPIDRALHGIGTGSFQKSLEVKVASGDFALQQLKPIGLCGALMSRSSEGSSKAAPAGTC